MEVIKKYEAGPMVIEPSVFKDDRGYFFESFNNEEFKKKTGLDITFVQDNESKSSYGVLRGMHFQAPPYAQSKLVRVIKGAVMDVIIDIREGSPWFGQMFSCYLSEQNHRQFFVPKGFAHGFITLQDNTVFQYKCDDYYNKGSEGGISWNTSLPYEDNGIPWEGLVPFKDIILSDKDKFRPDLRDLQGKNPFIYEEEYDIDEQ